MSGNSALSEKDANNHMKNQAAAGNNDDTKPDVKSLEYHRQVLKSKMDEKPGQQYISPSDNIMSPCTAKLTALKSRQAGKAKPKSLFAKASAKKLAGDNVFGAKTAGEEAEKAEN